MLLRTHSFFSACCFCEVHLCLWVLHNNSGFFTEWSPSRRCVLSHYILKLYFQSVSYCCVWLSRWIEEFFSLQVYNSVILLLKRREANSWSSYLKITICYLCYKLRGTFRYHVLLGITQAWNKRPSSPQTLCKYQTWNQSTSNRGL